MFNIITQIGIAVLSPLGVWLLAKGRRRGACAVGLIGQVFFVILYLCGRQYIMLLPTLIYTMIWIEILRKEK